MPAGDRLWFRLACRSWAAVGVEIARAAGDRLPRGKVTRTRGAAAAASVARAKMVFALARKDGQEGSEWETVEKFETGICRYAAGGGHLAVLQWARAEGLPWDERTTECAAANGHLAVLQWVRAQGCPSDGKTCSHAAHSGHLAVLQWARAQGCPWNEKTCSAAAGNGHLAVVQ